MHVPALQRAGRAARPCARSTIPPGRRTNFRAPARPPSCPPACPVLQDINGPCPLLAIANVLLLRNQLQLPAGVGEVSQGRLVQMVAGLLLDCNSQGGQRQQALSAEQEASLQHNLSDAIALLPKLTTGIDVNLRFHDTAGFEYTEETVRRLERGEDLLAVHRSKGARWGAC